jgi:hypothetical protein
MALNLGYTTLPMNPLTNESNLYMFIFHFIHYQYELIKKSYEMFSIHIKL